MICKFKKTLLLVICLIHSRISVFFIMIHIYVPTFLYAGKVLLNILLFYTFVYICIFYIVRYLVHIPQVRHKFGWFEYFKHVVVSNVCKFRIKVAQWTKINFLALKTLMLGIYLILSMWLGLIFKKQIREIFFETIIEHIWCLWPNNIQSMH